MSNDTPAVPPVQEVVGYVSEHRRRLETMTAAQLVAYALTGEDLPFTGSLSEDLLVAAQLNDAASRIARLIDSAVRDEEAPIREPSEELGIVDRLCQASEVLASRAHDHLREEEQRERVVAEAADTLVSLAPECPIPVMAIADVVLARPDASVMQVAKGIAQHLQLKGCKAPVEKMTPWLRGVAAEKFLALVRREVSS